MKHIAYQGETGAYSELAALQHFGNRVRCVGYPDFADVFEAVAAGTVDFGVVPIENSVAGSIHQNCDLLVAHNLHVVGEVYLRVRHCLIATPQTRRAGIREVYSHPQSLAQCRNYLKKHLPKAVLCPVGNNATAVRMVAEMGSGKAAAIASDRAAEQFGMTVLESGIEDYDTNTTRFLVLGKTPAKVDPKKGPVRTSIVFALGDAPGALFKALSVFALRDINLHKIESRPMKGKHFEYLFYIDIAGDPREPRVRNALNHLMEITTLNRVLGSYYVGKAE